MEWLMDGVRLIHVGAGFVGLAAFWVPVFTRKGASRHRLFGKVFKYSAYIVLTAAFVSVGYHIVDALLRGVSPGDAPGQFGFVVFLGYIAIATAVVLRHGLTVLEHKRSLSEMNRPLDRGLAWTAIGASVVIIAYAVYYNPPNAILLYALSPLGLLIGRGILAAVKAEEGPQRAWFYEHMGSMIGTGIAFHTAFAVFGSLQLWDLGLSGWIAVIPWVAPTLLGMPAIFIWTRHYQKKFGEVTAPAVE